MINRREQIKRLINDYFEDNETLQKDVYDFVCHNLWHLYNIYDTECHYEDVVNELEELGYDINFIPKTLIESIATSYDENLGDYGSENGWRYILENTIEKYKDDLKEYKNKEELA